MKMTKIDIFSGFLGAGKTTLIKKLIAEAFAGEKLVGGLWISGVTGEEDDDIVRYALSVFEECCK